MTSPMTVVRNVSASYRDGEIEATYDSSALEFSISLIDHSKTIKGKPVTLYLSIREARAVIACLNCVLHDASGFIDSERLAVGNPQNGWRVTPGKC